MFYKFIPYILYNSCLTSICLNFVCIQIKKIEGENFMEIIEQINKKDSPVNLLVNACYRAELFEGQSFVSHVVPFGWELCLVIIIWFLPKARCWNIFHLSTVLYEKS